uniref:Galactosylgalactosylxylosylprotein 3-beta-glucuronosyltransferase n=1 Tax=Saccoglossus kowalevskii TaxID=10224 RepID=A0ABM0GJC0_SACKO|nr:PREDICTED: galactosylgalactosylxylosylprotein 3-beta-glucuronosyltransferase 3-like [Saccoglossus kowalevskii]
MARIHLKKVVIVFVVLFFITPVILVIAYGVNCRNFISPLNEEDYRDAIAKKESPLKMKEDELKKYEERLNTLSVALRRQFPNAVEYILQILDDNIPTIYAITPTHTRHVQKAELVRLTNTFLHVKNFHWILVEDSEYRTPLVTNFLAQSGLRYTHLNTATPKNYKMKENDPHWLKPRGVEQRNLALDWLRENIDIATNSGVVYFADDDNTYSLQLFEEMRFTEKVSVWPVGITGGLKFERPIVGEDGKVKGWYAAWRPQRPFAMDMAGFALNLNLLKKYPNARFDITAKRGYLESSFLTQLVTLNELEPRAELCTKVLVWHTRTEKPKWKEEDAMIAKGQPSDPRVEV